MLEGIAGTTNMSFFHLPAWVDKEKNPGFTVQKLSLRDWWYQYVTLSFVFYSPNLIWLLIALVIWFVFPYDYASAEEGFKLEWVMKRCVVMATTTFIYTAFWHVSLYFSHMAKRPFKGNRQYKWSKLIHNMTYTLMGCLQWTLWECVFIHCYATKRLPYMADDEVYGSIRGMLTFVAWFFLIPLYRDVHFYFAHRFLHMKSLYKYVHSVHHRNTDIEPFAGLSMHPIEHLYYFSCVAPALYCYAPPFAFLWNGVHLLLSPAAAHSGFEDHFQADQFHYLHHRYFECNYGTSAIPFDHWFGTFCNKLKGSPKSDSEKEADIADAKANLLSSAGTSVDHLLFTGTMLCIFLLLLDSMVNDAGTTFAMFSAAGSAAGFPEESIHNVLQTLKPSVPQIVASLMSVGPVVTGALLILFWGRGTDGQSFRKLLVHPFHDESVFGPLGLHLCAGVLLCVVPVYHAVTTVLLAPGESVGCSFWGAC